MYRRDLASFVTFGQNAYSGGGIVPTSPRTIDRMMRVITLLLLLVTLTALSGCLIRTGPRYRSNGGQAVRSCPPAHHWEGGVCVHNGNGRHRGHR